MNIENLNKYELIKNYKELCAILGIEEKGGRGKTLQLKELARFFKFHKVGHKYIIDEIYEQPLRKVDKRVMANKVGKNNLYCKDIQSLIIDILARSSQERVYLSTNSFLKKLDMINNNYNDGRKNISKLSEIINVPKQYCYDFYYSTNNKLRDKLETALKSLRNRALISWEYCITVCIRTVDLELNELEAVRLDKSDKLLKKVKVIHRRATANERKLIVEIENEELERLGCDDMQQVFLSGEWTNFKKRVNQKLLYEANIEYYYNSYDVVYNTKNILKEINSNTINRADNTTGANLNNNICKFICNTAKTVNKRAKRNIENDKACNLDYLHAREEYINYTEILTNTVISKEAEDIREKLKEELELDKQSQQISLNI